MPDYYNHGERNLVINHRPLNYSGIFHVKELFETLNNALLEKGYTLRDKRNEEVVSESGKNYYLEVRPYKDKTKYITLLLKIVIRLRNVTRVTQEFDGNQITFDQGDIEIVFDSWVLSDYESRWTQNATYQFLKMIINYWLYQIKTEAGYKGELVGDTAFVYAKLKNLFASYRKRDMTFVSEEEVRAEIEKEMVERGRS